MRFAAGLRQWLIGGAAAERGTAAIEFAIVLPVLFLFAFGLIDLGRAVWTQTTLDYAAQAAARCAAIGTSCTNQTSGLAGVTVSVATATITTSGSTTTCTASNSNVNAERAVATASFTYFMPLLSHFSGQFNASACYPK